MPKGSEVVTGVDKLMDLVDKKQTLSVIEAAKLLAVPRVVIEEWVDFLEENGVVEVEYKFTTPYIRKKELTKKEVEKKSKEFTGKKEGFVRKIESSYTSIDNASSILKQIKDEFGTLSKELSNDVGNVKEDLGTLQNYEKLKQNLDKEIIASQSTFKADMEKINKEVMGKKEEYELLSKHIKEQELKIDEEIAKSELMKKNEDILKQRLKKIQDEIKAVEPSITASDTHADEARQKLSQLKDMADKFNQTIVYRQNELAPLIQKSKEHAKNITDLQNQLVTKIVEKKKKMDSATGSAVKEKLQRFFSFKQGLETEMSKVSKDLEDLKKELKGLQDEAIALRITARSSKSKDYIEDLEKKYQKTEQKKKDFESELLKLTGLLKGK